MLAAKDMSKNDYMIKKEKTGNVVTNLQEDEFLSPSPADLKGQDQGWSAEKETPQFNIEGKRADDATVKRGKGVGNILEDLGDEGFGDNSGRDKGGVKDPRSLNYDDETLDEDDL